MMRSMKEYLNLLAVNGEVRVYDYKNKLTTKLKEKKGLSGFVVVIILVVSAATIGVAFYALYKAGLIDLSTSSLDTIKGILSE